MLHNFPNIPDSFEDSQPRKQTSCGMHANVNLSSNLIDKLSDERIYISDIELQLYIR